MYTEEERAKWRRMFKLWKETGESPWSAGIRKEVSDNTRVSRQEVVEPVKKDFIAEAQRKHAAEAVGPDTRSSYQQKQSQAAKQYANEQYQKAKDDAKRAEGLELMMKTVSPSTYVEAATGLDLGNAGRFAVDTMLGVGINKLQLANKLFRLEKMVTGIPKKADTVTGELLPDLFRKGYSGTVWASNNADYARYFTNDGELFNIYFDPKKLRLLDTPNAPAGSYFVWNRLPFTAKRGKITLDPIAKLDNNSFVYKTKEQVLANTNSYGGLEQSGEALHPLMDPRLMNTNSLGLRKGLKTDHVVKYSKKLGYDGTKFHDMYDGGLEDAHGIVYDIPLEEVVINPKAEYFWTDFGKGRLSIFNKMPYKNTIPYTNFGSSINYLTDASENK